MQGSPSAGGFTLAEVLILLAITAALAVLFVVIAKQERNRRRGTMVSREVMALCGACEAYKVEHGGYPQDNTQTGNSASATDGLDARIHFDPTTAKYTASSLFLYKQLTGDENANGAIDAAETARKYADGFFKPSRFDSNFKTSGKISYFIDPYGYAFGYSTAGLKAEQDFQVAQQADPSAVRPSITKGYNPTFDLWSTGGSTRSTIGDEPRWFKNW